MTEQHGRREGVAGEVLERLERELSHTEIRRAEPLSSHTSFRIGGPADVLLLPHSVADLQRVIRLARELAVQLTIIGNGSNLIVRDGGLRGLVLKVAENLSEIRIEGLRVSAQSGALLAEVSRTSAVQGLGGLEFACGIPGTIGGGVMMNAGAYEGEMKDVVTRVRVLDDRGEPLELSPEQMEFSYRASVLQRRNWLVTDVVMELREECCERVLSRISRNQYLRESKQPLELPSAGSVFKRPPGKYVGPMIEKLGLKGFTIGGAQVSTKHAGFIVNRGGARAADVLALIDHIRERVQAEFDVWLEVEPHIIGEEPEGI